MQKHVKSEKQKKLVYLQEDMGLVSDFDHKIFEFMYRCQQNDINKEIKGWMKTL